MRRVFGWWVGVVLFAAGATWALGWAGAALAGVAAGYFAPRRSGPLALATGSTVLAWAAWLAVDARTEAFGAATGMVAEIIGRPVPVLVAATLGLGALLGLGGGLVGLALRHPLRQ